MWRMSGTPIVLEHLCHFASESLTPSLKLADVMECMVFRCHPGSYSALLQLTDTLCDRTSEVLSAVADFGDRERVKSATRRVVYCQDSVVAVLLFSLCPATVSRGARCRSLLVYDTLAAFLTLAFFVLVWLRTTLSSDGNHCIV